jgi:NADPH:quinone reductase-like Zn-dependent oxidoreductase
VHVDSVYPLFEAAQAHERLEAGTQFGKVVLSIPSEAALSRRAVGQ